jgi:hypothetical protein
MSEDITTEALYYRAHHSFLLQSPEFRTDFELLTHQYQSFPESFKVLSKPDVIRIRQMQDSYRTGRFTLFDLVPDLSMPNFPTSGKSDRKHGELCMEIWKRRESVLEPHTGLIDSACLEYPVRFGKVDLMVQSGSCAYIVEVKTETADHAIVGQVMKYFVGMCLKLILKMFNEIKIITLCPSYDEASMLGLRQIGAKALILNF